METITIIVKWSGNEYSISDLTEYDTVSVLKHEIFKRTQVRPARQKLLNLKYKGNIYIFEIFNVKHLTLTLKINK